MNRMLPLLLIAVASTSASAATLPREIAPRYAGLLGAIRKVDMKGFSTFFAKDYVSVDPSGKQTDRQAFLKAIAGLLTGAKSATTHFTCVRTSRASHEISVEFSLTVVTRGKPGGDVSVTEVGTDYWSKTNSGWLLSKTVDKSFAVKPLPAKGHAPPRRR